MVIILFLLTKLSAQVIYVHDERNTMYKYDVSNCTSEILVNMEQIAPINDIAFHPDGNLYGITDLGQLVFIDTLTGNLFLVHDFPFDFNTFSPFYTSLTIDANGVAYTAGDSQDLLTYDFSNDTETNLGNFGFVAAGDLTFYKGDLYVATLSDQVVKIDIDNPSNSAAVINASALLNLLGLVSIRNGCDDTETFLVNTSSNLATSSIHRVNLDINTLGNLVCNSAIGFLGAAHPSEYLQSTMPFSITEINKNGTTCGQDNGSFRITSIGGNGPFTYSLDGVVFQNSNLFENLASGFYDIYIEDELGCMFMDTATIGSSPSIAFELIPSDACQNQNNGGLSIQNIIGGTSPFMYSLDGVIFQDASFFENLAPGFYDVYIEDERGCMFMDTVTVGSNPSIDFELIPSGACQNQSNGGISIQNVIGGASPFKYSLDGVVFQDASFFENLAPGFYDVYIEDERGCMFMDTVTIGSSPSIEFELIPSDACQNGSNGKLTIQNIIGGAAPLEFSIDGENYSRETTINDLAPDMYNLYVRDANLCVYNQDFEIFESPELLIEYEVPVLTCDSDSVLLFVNLFNAELSEVQWNWSNRSDSNFTYVSEPGIYTVEVSNNCQTLVEDIQVEIEADLIKDKLFIPNLFSPNQDGINDEFKIFTASDLELINCEIQIFNRWGARVFQSNDINFSWDGTFNGKKFNSGVFVWCLKVDAIACQSNLNIFETGDVTIVR